MPAAGQRRRLLKIVHYWLSDLRRERAVGRDDIVSVLVRRLFLRGAVLERLHVLRDDLQRR